ncbi:cupin domain-containing protein [Candidatus Woesearchaeota archaeon]|nr:cupin domain-containing protein [Candidatus Woesearchaeota archaeon]
MRNKEFEKSNTYNLVEKIEYLPSSVVCKTIIKKATGNISLFAIDEGETFAVKISPFDAFIQIIDGIAKIVINQNSYLVKTGQSIIIPAHASNTFIANKRFKMISTIIKSGYEENNI